MIAGGKGVPNSETLLLSYTLQFGGGFPLGLRFRPSCYPIGYIGTSAKSFQLNTGPP